MNNEKIIISGIGVVSPIGESKYDFWNGLLQGKSCLSDITEFDTSMHFCHKAALMNDFNPKKYLGDKEKIYGRTTQLTLSAVLLALEDSGLNIDKLKNKKVGIILGTAMGESKPLDAMCVIDIDNKIPLRSEVLKLPDNMIATNVAKFFGINAYTLMIPNACSAGNYAMSYSMDLLKAHKIDIAITGGCDAFNKYAFMGFDRLMALSKDVCRPFDKNRSGIIIGEGAGVLIMERMNDTIKRNGQLYSELLGYGFSCDSYHMTIPHGDGIKRVINETIKNSIIKPDEIDLVCAHGTGTPMNDKLECMALSEFFGDSLKKIPVISIKSMVGHMMGAAGAVESIACILAIKESKIPPTINYETYDPDCPVDCVPNIMRESEVNIAINNNFAFGGNNAAVIFKKII